MAQRILQVNFKLPAGLDLSSPEAHKELAEDARGKWLVAQIHLSMPASGEAEGESFIPPPR